MPSQPFTEEELTLIEVANQTATFLGHHGHHGHHEHPSYDQKNSERNKGMRNMGIWEYRYLFYFQKTYQRKDFKLTGSLRENSKKYKNRNVEWNIVN